MDQWSMIDQEKNLYTQTRTQTLTKPNLKGLIGKLLIGDDKGVGHNEGHPVPDKEEDGHISDHLSINGLS